MKRQLLKTGASIFPVGLGCMSFGGFYGATDEAEAHRTLAAAADMGVDHLDTANVYGMGVSERYIGTFLKGDGSRFRIATKAGIWRDSDGKRGFNNSPLHLREELEASLKRLGLERVDLFYVHRRDPSIEIETVMETMLALKAEGKIGGIGFSEISPGSLRRACAVGPVDAVQNEYSLWSRMPDLGLIKTCEDLGVALVAFSPVARGMLADRPVDPSSFGENDFRRQNPRFMEPNFSLNVAQVERFKVYAADHSVSTAAMAMAWCLARSRTVTPIPGTRTAEHLAECVAGAHINMTSAMMDEIEQILPVGWAYGERYNAAQRIGPEGYC